MKKPSCHDELTIRHRFDRLCQMSLKGEAINYYRHMDYRREHEAMFSELSEKELNKDPYKITFIYKTGFKNEIGKAKERFDKSKSVSDKAKELCSHIVDEVKGVCSYVSDNTCGDSDSDDVLW